MLRLFSRRLSALLQGDVSVSFLVLRQGDPQTQEGKKERSGKVIFVMLKECYRYRQNIYVAQKVLPSFK